MILAGHYNVNAPLPNPLPQVGEGTITLSPARGRELERGQYKKK